MPRDDEGVNDHRRTDGLVPRTSAAEKRVAILRALEILTSVSRGLYVPDKSRSGTMRQFRVV